MDSSSKQGEDPGVEDKAAMAGRCLHHNLTSFKICNLPRIDLRDQIVYLGFTLVTVTSFLPCQDFTSSSAKRTLLSSVDVVGCLYRVIMSVSVGLVSFSHTV